MVDVASVQVSAVDSQRSLRNHGIPSNFLYTSTDTGATWQQLYPTYPGEPRPANIQAIPSRSPWRQAAATCT